MIANTIQKEYKTVVKQLLKQAFGVAEQELEEQWNYNDYYQVIFFNRDEQKMQSFSKSCLLHIAQTEQITAQNSLFNTGGMLGWILTLH